jgi:hypothetical protein
MLSDTASFSSSTQLHANLEEYFTFWWPEREVYMPFLAASVDGLFRSRDLLHLF